MEEIKAILNNYDIAALVVLHTPGHSEYVMHVNPSYSCATFDGDLLRIKAQRADFPTVEAWQEKVANTSNMLALIGETGARISMNILDIGERVDKIVKAEHTDGGHSSHTEQNN